MPNDHFGMPFVMSFYRIIRKIIVKIFGEVHNYFYRDRVMNFTLHLWVSSIASAFDLYKQEQLSFVV